MFCMNICNIFFPGIFCFPCYRGVRYRGVSARRESTVYRIRRFVSEFLNRRKSRKRDISIIAENKPYTHHKTHLHNGNNNNNKKKNINNIHEKITQFWLAEKGVQLFCNTSAKLVTQVQITNGFWLAENTKQTTKNQSD